MSEPTMERNPEIPIGSRWVVRVCKTPGQIDGGGGLVVSYTITNGWQRMHASVADSYRWQRPHAVAGSCAVIARRVA